jgi:hypothetical protein
MKNNKVKILTDNKNIQKKGLKRNHKMRLLLILAYLVFNILSFAQETTFKKIYGQSNIYSLSVNNENEYFLSGSIPVPYEYSPSGTHVIKINNFGDLIWEKTFEEGAVSNTMRAKVSIIDKNNNLIIGGSVNTLLSHGMTPTKIVLTKLNQLGDSLWWKEFGDGKIDYQIHSLIQDTDDSFILVGRANKEGHILKINLDGDSLYSKYYKYSEYGTDFWTIHKSDNEGFIILGTYTIITPNFREFNKFFVIKVDNNGDTLFTKTYGADNSAFSVSDLFSGKTGGYVFLLNTRTSSQPSEEYTSLIRMDSSGEIFSEHKLSERAFIITATYDGNFIVSNNTVIDAKTKNINLYKYDIEGNLLWGSNITFTDADALTTSVIKETPDSGIVLSGFVSINNYPHAFLVKANSEGVVVNVKVTENIIEDHILNQNYPNPFNPSTVISWQLAVRSYVTLKVYDVPGREVATLIDNEWKEAGIYNYKLSVTDHQLPSGAYFYRLNTGNFLLTKKMLLSK